MRERSRAWREALLPVEAAQALEAAEDEAGTETPAGRGRRGCLQATPDKAAEEQVVGPAMRVEKACRQGYL